MKTLSTSPTKAANLGQKQAILQEASRFLAIEQLLYQSLDAPLAKQCHVTGWRNGILKILVEGAAWATLLRFQIPQLLNDLQGHLPSLQFIECRVMPQQGVNETTYWRPAAISSETKEMLCYVSDSVTDEKLKAALLRLAKR